MSKTLLRSTRSQFGKASPSRGYCSTKSFNEMMLAGILGRKTKPASLSSTHRFNKIIAAGLASKGIHQRLQLNATSHFNSIMAKSMSRRHLSSSTSAFNNKVITSLTARTVSMKQLHAKYNDSVIKPLTCRRRKSTSAIDDHDDVLHQNTTKAFNSSVMASMAIKKCLMKNSRTKAFNQSIVKSLQGSSNSITNTSAAVYNQSVVFSMPQSLNLRNSLRPTSYSDELIENLKTKCVIHEPARSAAYNQNVIKAMKSCNLQLSHPAIVAQDDLIEALDLAGMEKPITVDFVEPFNRPNPRKAFEFNHMVELAMSNKWNDKPVSL